MKLENQVISLDLAKKLKELGAKQESIFQWIPYPDGSTKHGEWYLQLVPIRDGKGLYNMTGLSAYTVAELLELMPEEMTDDTENSYSFTLTKAYDFWVATWENGEYSTGEQIEDRKASDCLAKMLIYLLENDLCQV